MNRSDGLSVELGKLRKAGVLSGQASALIEQQASLSHQADLDFSSPMLRQVPEHTRAFLERLAKAGQA